MRAIWLCVALLLISTEARSAVMWNQPNVAPYITSAERKNPRIVEAKVNTAISKAVVQDLFSLEVGKKLKLMAMQVLTNPTTPPAGCSRTVLVPVLQITLMSSGKDRFIPNVVVGEWATQNAPTKASRGAWMCRVYDSGLNQEVYLLIPDACLNLAFIVMQSGVCVPNPHPCDGDCKRYAGRFVS